MKIASFGRDIIFNDNKIATQIILETTFSKEIQILLKQGQLMKEHKAPSPIIVHILEGKIDFGVTGTVHNLIKNDIITLETDVPHDLTAIEDSVVRLTLSKKDNIERVQEVIKNP